MKITPSPMILLAVSLLLCACSDNAGHPDGIQVPVPTREVHCAPDTSVAARVPATIATVACRDSASRAS